jgi:hypothetical protein
MIPARSQMKLRLCRREVVRKRESLHSSQMRGRKSLLTEIELDSHGREEQNRRKEKRRKEKRRKKKGRERKEQRRRENNKK